MASLPAGTSESRSSTCWSGSSSSSAQRTKSSGSSRSSAPPARPRPRRGRRARCRLRARRPRRRAGRPGRPGRVTGSEDRQRARCADRVEVAVHEQRLGAVGLGALCCFGPVDGDDQRDAVALGYGLAQTSRAGHAAECVPRSSATGAVVRGRVAIVVVLAALPGGCGRCGAEDGARDTARADFLAGTARLRQNRCAGRQRPDRRRVRRRRRRVSCGAGRDVVSADARDRVRTDCEVVSRRIHRDRHTNPESQHESEVEPDSQTVGQTTVAVFQVGRNRTGGAASIGFSTSKDGGRTWREGIAARADHGHEPAWAVGAGQRSGASPTTRRTASGSRTRSRSRRMRRG